ncbi:hypothetical protein [Flavobacterium sp.]|uniref:hypothetical protein n=1 Tax=Flavobacterium sp. TaxID=239 RepID=UPI002636CDCF|nr:hypothetical protein [Flavobacterium sp.]
MLLVGVGTSHAAQNKNVETNQFQSIIERMEGPKYKAFEPGSTFVQEISLEVEEELLNSDEHADNKGAYSLVYKEDVQPWHFVFSFQTAPTKSITNLKYFKQVHRYANPIYILHNVLRI